MSRKPKNWMAMFPSDLFGCPDTLDMGGPARGAYVVLMMRSWQVGPLRDPVGELVGQRYTRSQAKKVWEEVAHAWIETDQGWHSHLLEEFQSRGRDHRLRMAKRRGRHTQEEWKEMLGAYGQCLACGSTELLQKDHVISLMAGGSDSIQNLQPLCRSCNASKRAACRDFRPGHPATKLEWLPEIEAQDE